MKLFKHKLVWTFLGGALAGELLKTKTFRETAVKTVAGTMKMTRCAQSSLQSIKEDAEDMLHDEENECSCGCGCEE